MSGKYQWPKAGSIVRSYVHRHTDIDGKWGDLRVKGLGSLVQILQRGLAEGERVMRNKTSNCGSGWGEGRKGDVDGRTPDAASVGMLMGVRHNVQCWQARGCLITRNLAINREIIFV